MTQAPDFSAYGAMEQWIAEREAMCPPYGAQLDYYVYALVDPRSGQPFYIGKGKKRRAEDHLRPLRASAIRTPKERHIANLRRDGIRPHIAILAHDMDEDSAYEIEASYINWCRAALLNNPRAGRGDDRAWARDTLENRIHTREEWQVLYPHRDVQLYDRIVQEFQHIAEHGIVQGVVTHQRRENGKVVAHNVTFF